MRPSLLVVAVAIVVAGAAGLVYRSLSGETSQAGIRVTGMAPCEVPVELLQRVWRGYSAGRSGDVLTIEWAPNQFAGIRHSTPFPYTQDVPLLLYGPRYVRAGITSSRAVTVADLAPTGAALLGFDDFPKRDGEALEEALRPEAAASSPRLIITVVWDGGGDNLLRQWPEAWSNLKSLVSRSTFFDNATVGSSPSITPAVHSTIGTGVFPKTHGQTDMILRVDDEMQFVWGELSPRFLETATLADLWDRARGNAPLVGAMARSSYHLGMLGHGAYLRGGDKDIAVVDETDDLGFRTNTRYYRLPSYLGDPEELAHAVRAVDRRDGRGDGVWLDNPISADDPLVRATPAWPIYQTTQLVELLRRERFGADRVPDLLYVNYKSTDLAGHRWNLVEPEERAVLREQDRQLRVLLEALDHHVGRRRYVLALTADHGISPYPSDTGGWPISGDELLADIQAELGEGPDEAPLVRQNRGYQLFLDPEALREQSVAASDIAEFIRNYTIRDNAATQSALEGFRDRADERVFMTATTPAGLRAALACAAAGS